MDRREGDDRNMTMSAQSSRLMRVLPVTLVPSTVKAVNQHAAGGKLIVLTTAVLAYFGVGLALAGPSDAEKLHALIVQVLKAYGGEGQLRSPKGFSLRWKVLLEGETDKQGTETRLFVQLPDRARIEMEIPGPHGRTKLVTVYHGGQTWVKYGDYATEGVTEPGGRAGSVVDQYFPPSTILKLKDPEFRATWLGERPQEGRAVLGVELARKDGKAFALEGGAVAHKVRLFFDRETGLLLKSEREFAARGKIQKVEILYQDYGILDGIPVAQKYVHKTDGKVASRTEILEFKTADKLDDKLFEKP